MRRVSSTALIATESMNSSIDGRSRAETPSTASTAACTEAKLATTTLDAFCAGSSRNVTSVKMCIRDRDRSAAAMLVAGSDERGRAGIEDAELMAGVFAQSGATEVFSTDDPDEGEAFVAARRFCIPAVEAKGSLLLEDVGVPLPALGQLVTGIAGIAAERDLMISVIAHAGDGNTHPLIVYDPADAAMTKRAHLAFGEIMDLAVGLGLSLIHI